MGNCVKRIHNSELEKHLWAISPFELKVYIVICLLCEGTDKLTISTYNLAEKSNLKWKAVEDSLLLLKKRGLIAVTLEQNPFVDIEITLCFDIDSEPFAPGPVRLFDDWLISLFALGTAPILRPKRRGP